MKYDCQRTREFLGLYLDNELEAVPTQRVAAHLSTCAPCQRELDLLRSEAELLAHSIKSVEYDTERLRASIEAAIAGRQSGWWPERLLPRLPKWAIATASALILAVSILLYLPGRMGLIGASPLYSAAADNHWTCIEESEKSDWARSQAEIVSLQASFLDQMGRAPVQIGDFRLARARVCDLDEKKFLHLVYVDREGRAASLFFGRNLGLPPPGDQTVTLGGHIVHMTGVANLHITSTQVGERLLIAASNSEGEAATMLLNVLAVIRV